MSAISISPLDEPSFLRIDIDIDGRRQRGVSATEPSEVMHEEAASLWIAYGPVACTWGITKRRLNSVLVGVTLLCAHRWLRIDATWAELLEVWNLDPLGTTDRHRAE